MIVVTEDQVKATIGNVLAPPLCLVMEKIAPSTHQHLSLCAAYVQQERQTKKCTFLTCTLVNFGIKLEYLWILMC